MLERKRSYRLFLTKVNAKKIKGAEKIREAAIPKVWAEIDCTTCANCCKKMTPTFTPKDLKRISAHFGETVNEFKEKWLYKEKKKDGDWMNRSQPCQFLNLKNNLCTIYEIRPEDCASFPHFHKKVVDYAHVHKQNILYCPATLTLVEKMKELSHSFT